MKLILASLTMQSIDSFNTFVESFAARFSLNYKGKCLRTILMLGDYVLDHVFAHDHARMDEPEFNKLTLSQVEEYNGLYAKYSKLKYHKTFYVFTPLMSIYAFLAKCGVNINIYNDMKEDDCLALRHLCNETSVISYPRIDYLFNDDFILTDQDMDVDKDDLKKQKFIAISIDRLHDDDEYEKAFSNREAYDVLKSVLIRLLDERMKYTLMRVNESKYEEREVEFVELLVRYCEKLLIEFKPMK